MERLSTCGRHGAWTVVVDLAGLESLFGSDEKIAQTLQLRAANVGLNANVAVAANIDTSIVAARGFAGITLIPADKESRRLGELPVQAFDRGIETLEMLERWGIGTSARAGRAAGAATFGTVGAAKVSVCTNWRAEHGCARWCSPSRICNSKRKWNSMRAVEELEPLSFLLGRLLDQLCARLEARALAVRAIHVWFALEPSFEEEVQTEKEESRKKTAAREYKKVLTLPVAMRDPKMLLKLLRLSLQGDPPKSPMQKIVMVGDAAPPRVAQSGLFVPKGPDPEKLELTVARLAKLVGEGNVGSAELIDTHRSENFRMEQIRSALRSRQKSDEGMQLFRSELGT